MQAWRALSGPCSSGSNTPSSLGNLQERSETECRAHYHSWGLGSSGSPPGPLGVPGGAGTPPPLRCLLPRRRLRRLPGRRLLLRRLAGARGRGAQRHMMVREVRRCLLLPRPLAPTEPRRDAAQPWGHCAVTAMSAGPGSSQGHSPLRSQALCPQVAGDPLSHPAGVLWRALHPPSSQCQGAAVGMFAHRSPCVLPGTCRQRGHGDSVRTRGHASPAQPPGRVPSPPSQGDAGCRRRPPHAQQGCCQAGGSAGSLLPSVWGPVWGPRAPLCLGPPRAVL